MSRLRGLIVPTADVEAHLAQGRILADDLTVRDAREGLCRLSGHGEVVLLVHPQWCCMAGAPPAEVPSSPRAESCDDGHAPVRPRAVAGEAR